MTELSGTARQEALDMAREVLERAENHAQRGRSSMPIYLEEAAALALLATSALDDTRLAAARAEGARDMRTKIETLADEFHDRAQSHAWPTPSSMAYRDAWRSASGALRAFLADGGEPQPEQVQPCGLDAGSRPYWMGVDQYDPCPCVRPKGHDGEHGCADHDKPTDAVGGEPQ